MRVNNQIKAPKVRVIGSDGQQIGIKNITEALDIAASQGFDLVEVASEAKPPVCKLMDYGKFKYKQSKKEKSTKKKQHIVHVKEIRLRPKIEEHDFNFKTNNARKFLEKGNKVKATVLFRGRELAHLEYANELLQRMAEKLEDIAKVEREPVMEGRTMIMYLTKK
ncbi:MAG: translation initiation factor IF-3 [bacterium]